MPLAIALGIAAFLWPVVLGAALVDRLDHPSSMASAVVYAAASRVCHQDPARSFHTGASQWPVCARCSGLYLAAPVGAVAALVGRRRLRGSLARVVTIAAVPMAITWGLEAVGGVQISGLVRAATAVPLGAALAGAFVVLTAAGPLGSNRID